MGCGVISAFSVHHAAFGMSRLTERNTTILRIGIIKPGDLSGPRWGSQIPWEQHYFDMAYMPGGEP